MEQSNTGRWQTKLTFQIGLPSDTAAAALVFFTARLARAASRVCGGCTITRKDGYWMETGGTHAEQWEGYPTKEICIELELTCEERKADMAYEAVKDAIVTLTNMPAIETDWVHVTQTVMQGRHFSVQSERKQAAPVSENAMRMQSDPPSEEARAVGPIPTVSELAIRQARAAAWDARKRVWQVNAAKAEAQAQAAAKRGDIIMANDLYKRSRALYARA